MKRVVTNYQFLKKCTKGTFKQLSAKISEAKEEEIKSLVECVANSVEDSSVRQLLVDLKNCKDFKGIKKILNKNRRVVKSCVAVVLSEILCCVLNKFEGEDHASDDESNSN